MTYPQIAEASGIEESRIKSAGSILINHGLLHIEQQPSLVSEYGYSNGYRLAMIDTRRHAGTTGRADAGLPFADVS